MMNAGHREQRIQLIAALLTAFQHLIAGHALGASLGLPPFPPFLFITSS